MISDSTGQSSRGGGSGFPSVAFLIGSLSTGGGAERQLTQLATGLARRGWPVRVCTVRAGGWDESLQNEGVPVVCLNKKNRYATTRSALRLRRELYRPAPDVVQTMLVNANVFATAVRPLLRSPRLVWGLRSSGQESAYYDRTHRFLTWVESSWSHRPDLIIANAEAGRTAALARGFPPDRVAVVPNGIDADQFRPCRTDRALRAQWLGGAEGPLIGFVARLTPMKDHATFLLAAHRFAARRPGARFICLGAGRPEYAAALRRKSAALGLDMHVRWEGSRTDMTAVYNACDMATLSSAFGEGFPNVVGEAMACELPVVATNVGDCAAILGDAGIVVPPRDPDRLAAGWEEVAALPAAARRNLRARARARIVESYSVDTMVEQTASYYRALVAGA